MKTPKQVAFSIAMTSAMALTGIGMSAMPVFAATPTASGSGVQGAAPNGQTYTTTDDKGTGAWDTATNDASTDVGGNGQVDLVYDTTNGTWKDSQYPDSGTDEEKAKHTHQNGTYVVRIPKAIKYENMNVGTVATSDDYDVTVEGVLANGKTVTVNAESGKDIATGGTKASADDKITETTSMVGAETKNTAGAYSADNFRTFSADQTSVLADAASGKVKGTTVKDNIAMNGIARSAGKYVGTVQYSSELK